MKIAVGNSRMDKKWKNREISWDELCQKVSTTIRTTETVEEYRKLKKGSQDSRPSQERHGIVPLHADAGYGLWQPGYLGHHRNAS